jgi:hypothetical protein
MANKTLLTAGLKYLAIQQMYYSPVALAGGNRISSIYCFLSKVDPWSGGTPPDPTQDVSALKRIMRNIFVVKNIKSSEISPVIKRINWEDNTVYDYYSDTIDLFATTPLVYNFYVKNKYDQVFKCLWNNNGSTSIDEPYFQPGSYDTNNIFTGSDGYKWKYIYTVDLAAKYNFMDSEWLPVPVKINPLNPISDSNISSGYGSIDVINVVDGGSGYNQSTAPITLKITGDGTGATATAVTSGGAITNIIMNSKGSNYTYANISITTTSGSGAILEVPISPIGGHGADPMSELGCSHIMITSTFNGSEQDSSGVNMIPTDIDYHQLGILINPTALSSSPNIAQKNIYKTTTDLVLAGGFGNYTLDEIVYQGSADNPTFSGTVLSFDTSTNILKILNTTGTLTTSSLVVGQSSGTSRTLMSYSTPDFISLSGYVAYIENRDSIQRSSDGIEQFKIVLGY